MARHFKKHEGKLWVFLAHAIERSQEIHRNIIGALAGGSAAAAAAFLLFFAIVPRAGGTC